MADYRTLARRTARKYGVPESVFLAMIGVESSWRPKAISSAGAVGLGQLMPGTARGLGVDPFDPKQNLDGAARYLRMQIDRFGNVRDALRAYNQGPNAISDASAGASYADKILGGSPKSASTRARAGAPRKSALPASRDDFLKIAFADDPEFLDLLQSVQMDEPPEQAVSAGPRDHRANAVQYAGKKMILPTSWSGTHVTDGLGWGTKTASDLMAKAGTLVGAPESGEVVRWGSAQGGQSMYFRGKSGRLYWLGHLDNIARPGTKVRRGQVLARVSADHPRPHVHIDAR